MKIFIKDIRPEGIDVDYDIPAEAIGLTDSDYLYFISPVHVKAHIDLVDDVMLCKAKVLGRYKSFCSRTLVNVERDWADEFMLDFAVDNEIEFVDLDENIRQEVILGVPVKVLCDEEMKKEAREEKTKGKKTIVAEAEKSEKTHQPFANLKWKKE